MQAAISKAKRTDKKEKSSQDSIPYLLMRQDGICQVTRNHYTKTIQFRDINYQLSDNEDKQAIFDSWCDFLNYFDSSVSFQLSFINLTGLRGAALRTIPVRTDRFESIQRELSGVIQNQQEKGNNGIVKTKYLTFGIDADSVRSAKPRLERIETDILNNFKKLGVSAQVLTGKERLKVCHDILRMDTPESFLFRWEDLPRSGLSTKDYIAPSSFYFGRARDFRMGRKFATVSFLQILAPELSDRVLKDFLDIESNVIVNIHVQSVDQVSAIKTIKRTITDLDKTKIEEQKKAVRAGYDMDILPSDLATYGEEAKKLLSDLQSRNQRMFLITFLILNTADSKRQLDNNFFQTNSIAQKYNCQLVQLDFQQEEGMVSSLPLGLNQIEIQRGLTSSGVAIFVPFTTQELFQNSPEALYCGINALSNNIIMVDRKWLKNPNGLILGTPGSGKSFAAKREIANVFLVTNDDIKPNSMEIIHSILYPVFRLAVRDEYIRMNPTEGAMSEIKRTYDWEKPKRIALTIPEQEMLIDFLNTSETYCRWKSIITFFLGTGCRVGEVIGLRWEDCDFEKKTISINHNTIYRKYKGESESRFHITTPKTKAGIRMIPMLSDVKNALLAEYNLQQQIGFCDEIIDGYSGFVFQNRFGSLLSSNDINRALERIYTACNNKERERAKEEKRPPVLIRHFSVHNLRHTFCTRFCENESNLKVIQEIMGHADIETTMNIYAEATTEKKVESFANLEGKIKIS